MSESDSMEPGEAIFRSPLYKTLDQLTEEDISQLTREDCRRFLKEKGMRRPSWNKSQAIEQVISLKKLLEATSDSGAGVQNKISVSRPENIRHVPVTSPASENETAADIQISASADESVPYRRKDPPKPASPVDLSGLVPDDNNAISSRTTDASSGLVGQMTIFYCGKINVYEGITADKQAQAIMQLASGSIHACQATPSGGTTVFQPFPCHLQLPSVRPGLTRTHVLVSPTNQTMKMTESSQHCKEGNMPGEVDPDFECPPSRKASLQRYLEKRKDRYLDKRKDRFKSKQKVGEFPSSSFERYLNPQVRIQTPNEQSSQSSTCSPPETRQLQTPTRICVDLNEKGTQEG